MPAAERAICCQMDFEDKIARHCWTKEGLWGDSSCPELAERIHCYNCPAYSEAGKRLFDRRAPVEYVDEWSDEISEARSDSGREKIPYFLFKCGGENFALEMGAVSEVGRDRFIHKIPHRGEGVISGLANVNGELVIAVDVARLLGIPARAASGDSVRMVVCSNGGDRFAFRVEKISGMALVEPSSLRDVPVTLEKSLGGFVDKIFDLGGARYGVIDFGLFVHAIIRNHL